MKAAICRQTQMIWVNDREQEVAFIPEFQSYDPAQVEDAVETMKNQRVILTLIHDPSIELAQKVEEAQKAQQETDDLKAENEKLIAEKAQKTEEAQKTQQKAEALKSENEKLKAELAAMKAIAAKASEKKKEEPAKEKPTIVEPGEGQPPVA